MASQQSRKLQVAELDFDSIKDSLKAFLKRSDSPFKDYDFEGSGLNILLEILAYNTHYMGIYLNMAANEPFLNNVTKKSSAVSICKHLDYLPSSKTASSAYVSFNIEYNGVYDPNTHPKVITIPKYLAFSSVLDGINYIFYSVNDTHVDIDTDGTGAVDAMKIKEGQILQQTYVVDSSDPDQKFIIPTKDVDTTTLVVIVQDSLYNTHQQIFTYYDNINEVTANSNVYFLELESDERYRIFFGDGVLGKNVIDGNVIIINYIKTHGASSNRCNYFKCADSLPDNFIISSGGITTFSNADISAYSSGGSDAETLQQIQYKAPRSFSAQNRSVTPKDYKIRLLKDFSSLSSVNVWGGEENDPPEYGKVFIAVRPSTGLTLTEIEKSEIKTALKKYNVVGIEPTLLNPDYIYIELNSKVEWDPDITVRSGELLKNIILTNLGTYNTNTLSLFTSEFEYSDVTALIDQTDVAIMNNLTKVYMKKKIVPNLFNVLDFRLKFSNPIMKPLNTTVGYLTSTYFTYNGNPNCRFEDDPRTGIIKIYYIDASKTTNQKQYINLNAGTINYETGLVNINFFKPTAYDGTGIFVKVIPEENNIKPSREQILTLESSDIKITMIPNPSSKRN